MDILFLRLIHIVVGAFWVGAVFTNVLFLQPTAMAVGPDAAKFQFHLLKQRRFSTAILLSGATTVIAGVLLLWITSGGLDPDLLFHPSRLGFTVGGVAAILTFAFGSTYIYPRTERVGRIMGGAFAEGRGPTPEEGAHLGRIRAELLRAGWITVVGLGIAITAMATARNWPLL